MRFHIQFNVYDIESSEKLSTVQCDTKTVRGTVQYNTKAVRHSTVQYKSSEKRSTAQYHTKVVRSTVRHSTIQNHLQSPLPRADAVVLAAFIFLGSKSRGNLFAEKMGMNARH